MKFTIEIDLDHNFREYPEASVSNILRETADKVTNGEAHGTVKDKNRRNVVEWGFTD